MANDHKDTLEYLSSVLGTHTRSETVKPSLFRRLWRRERPHTQQVERPLMYPHQLREYLGRNVIVTRNGKRPLRLKAVPYYKELPVYHYEADRNFSEQPLRRLTRSLCVWLEKELPIYQKRLQEYIAEKTTAMKKYKARKVKFSGGK